MPKRKAGVMDIIYELDDDNIEISSEEECTDTKVSRLDMKLSVNETGTVTEVIHSQVIKLNESDDTVCEIISPTKTQNGGKTIDTLILDGKQGITNNVKAQNACENEINSNKKLNNECPNATIFNEDIVIDSPASNSDPGVVGCENRTPLATVRFRDKKLAKYYKEKLKTFMLNLMKLHDEECLTGSETETDLEIDIWPEDLIEEAVEEKREEPADNLFFVDTAPYCNEPIEIPTYSQTSTVISNASERETTPPLRRRGPICFNCNGAHPLRECPKPKNNARIQENRKHKAAARVGRYHVEDDQKYGHLIPGRISGELRHALGLKRHELPMFIYRMRVLGYPPGWLEEARISHSGISMFDSAGNAIQDPDEEEGEVCEPGSKDKYDIKKIYDFPGFNVQASSRYKEEAHLFGLPPMLEQDSKIIMLQALAPNAMKAYKRKKLTFFPSAGATALPAGQAEMELDSGDETAEFPSVPPLPDDEPPPPPPPPDTPPPPQSDVNKETSKSPDKQEAITLTDKSVNDKQETMEWDSEKQDMMELPDEKQEAMESSDGNQEAVESADKLKDDLEVIEVTQVKDIPVPPSQLITIDIDDDDEHQSQKSSGLDSPSLDDLEAKKRLLLNALEVASPMSADVTIIDQQESIEVIASETPEPSEIVVSDGEMQAIKKNEESKSEQRREEINQEVESNDGKHYVTEKDVTIIRSPVLNISTSDCKDTSANSDSDSDSRAASNKTGHVKQTLYGAPIINVVSEYTKRPSDDKFSKDICDVINFENLPNSTGKYKQISSILKRVKSEVDRIQES